MHINDSSTENNGWFNTATIDNSKIGEFSKTQSTLFKYLEKTNNNEYRNLRGIRVAAGLYYNFGDIPFKYGNDISNHPYNCGMINSVTVNGRTYNSSNTTEVNGKTLFKLNDKVSRVRTLTIEEVNNILRRPHTYNNEYNDEQTTIPEGAPNVSEYVRSLIDLKDFIAKIPGMGSFSYYTGYGLYFLASPSQGYNYGIYRFICATGGFGQNSYNTSCRFETCYRV